MNILSTYDQLLSLCNEFKEPDAGLTVEQVDKLIDIILSVKKLSYLESNKLRDALRKQYSALFEPNEQFRMHMKWKVLNNTYDTFRDVIISNLKDETIFPIIKDAIEQDKLHFTLSEVAQIPSNFITYCITNFDRCTEVIDDDYSSDDVVKPPKCTSAELFLVNALSVYDDKSALLRKIGHVSAPSLRLMPAKYTVLEGEDLLEQIYDYYAGLELSPVLGSRRNIVVLNGNIKTNAYDFQQMKDGFVYAINFAAALCLEFPYMCYVYPESFSVQIEDDETKKIRFSASAGTDVLEFSSLKQKENDAFARPAKTQTHTHTFKPCAASKGPYTYITCSTSPTFVKIGCPRLKGKAVILC